MLIRWIGTEVRIFAYLLNAVLVVCFLGLWLYILALLPGQPCDANIASNALDLISHLPGRMRPAIYKRSVPSEADRPRSGTLSHEPGALPLERFPLAPAIYSSLSLFCFGRFGLIRPVRVSRILTRAASPLRAHDVHTVPQLSFDLMRDLHWP